MPSSPIKNIIITWCISVLLALSIAGCTQVNDVPSCIKEYVNKTESTMGQLALTEACKKVYSEKVASQREIAISKCFLKNVTGANNWIAAASAINSCKKKHAQ